MLSFDQLRKANASRCKRWHKAGIEEWSITDGWAVAELGAAYNIASIGEELADRLIYLDLLAHRLGIDLAAETIKKFNAASQRYGFPERLE